MFRRTRSVFLFVVGLGAAVAPALALDLKPPMADKKPHLTVTHGDTLRDDYFWLREKTSPGVLHYLEAENAYVDAVMEPTKALQKTLYEEMLGRIKETDEEVPYREGGYYYYSRTEEGKQYVIYARKPGSLDAKEQVILDVNQLAVGHAFMGVADLTVSDDGNFLAFSTDTTGFRQYDLHVKNLKTGEILPDHAERVTTIAWAADNRTLFYTQEDPVSKRWYRLYRHGLGSDHDDLVYEEKDELFDIYAWRSRSRAYIFVGAASSTTSEMWFIRADRPTEAPATIAGRRDGREYYVDHAGKLFYLRTNDTGRNFRLVSAPVTAPGEVWTELVPHRDDVMLENIDCFAGHYVLEERENGVPRLRVVDIASGASHNIDMPEPVYQVSSGDNYEFDTTVFRFGYESFITPESVYDYDVKTKQRTLLKQMPVLGGYDPKRYRSERLYATATDGARIPISIVYRVDAKEKRPHGRPMLLMGYGSYGISMDVSFSSNRVSLLDRGMIYGIAHVRGGGELGKRWHEEGRLMAKRNTFTDYIACAEYLIAQGYTSKEQIAAIGGSAGGLLMGATVNLRPDLFKAVVAQVPFVDVMNTMLDASLPLTTQEYLEWGDPNQKAAYDYMRSYSPYDNVGHKAYPVMLVRTSFNDSQVMYWEPAKWVAKLRANKTDDHLLLFKIKLDPGGHGGASGRYDRLHDAAFDYAFVLTQLGVVHTGATQ
jgi:oligopeptidase B